MTSASNHPESIGPYRLVRVLGEGGMGVVYLAEQSEPLRREVALKILKPGMDTEQVVARFRSERQALAVMEHPGIARVFDAGTTESGRPYFVMELVDGVPITQWCDERRLGVRDRVSLFEQVCRAVQHAHLKGVIHRDLKPSNVLVTSADGERPQVKVIDFGIARAVEPDTDVTRLTQLDQSIGTPAYMSPEQARASGLDVDTRTDVYSLGVLLYELVAGALPFDDAAYRGWAFLAHHLVKDPPRPSARLGQLPDAGAVAEARRTSVDALTRELEGALDWVVLKALEKDRDRRYDTANGLAMDLQRYLASEPVVARPPSRGYRARLFVRRHRAGVAAAAVLVLLLSGFAVAMTVQAQRVARARDAADARRGQAEGLIDFMLGDLRTKLTAVGRLDILDDVGDRALQYFALLPEEELDGDELSRRAEGVSQLGQVRLEQGDLPAAIAAFRESLELARELASRDPDRAEWQVGLSAAHFWVGYVHWLQGDPDAALQQFEPYLEISRALVDRHPENAEYRAELAYAWSNLGSVREARGDLEGALEAFEETLAQHRAMASQDPENDQARMDLAHSHNTAAVVLRKLGRLERAERLHREELALKESLVRKDTLNMLWRRYLSFGHHYLALTLEARGDAEAGLHHQRNLEIAGLLRQRDPDNADWQRGLAVALRAHAGWLVERGRPEEGLEPLREAGQLLDELIATDSTVMEWIRDRTTVRTTTVLALLGVGQLAAAEVEARAAVEDAERTLRLGSAQQQVLNAAEAEVVLGRVLARRGDSKGAAAARSAALARLEVAGPAARDIRMDALRAEALLGLGRRDEGGRVVTELLATGYKAPQLLALVGERGGEP